jgi:mannose-6-phosphate isomerase
MDAWQGIDPARDGYMPESWIASTITSRYDPDPDAGLSFIEGGDESGKSLKDYIEEEPETRLGTRHVANHGTNLGYLTKIIDSDRRLNIQTHPSRAKAKELFNSDYGKTEAWYVIGTREIDGEASFILMGFKPGITRSKWQNLVQSQDIPGLVSCLHKIPVQPGDVFFIDSGIPHAIGSGCLIAEIQEPTDITIRVEKAKGPDGKPYPDEVYHQGLGFEKMFDCFDYIGYTEEELLAKAKVSPSVISQGEDFEYSSLIGPKQTSFFTMDTLSLTGTSSLAPAEHFRTAVVLSGSGRLVHGGKEMHAVALSPSAELFIPPSAKPMEIIAEGGKLELLVCGPPRE